LAIRGPLDSELYRAMARSRGRRTRLRQLDLAVLGEGV
jgi:hypothetical protein